MKNKDVLQVVVSDFHSGSNHSLFPDRFWQGGRGNNHSPTSQQVQIRKQFELFAKEVNIKRKGKKVRLIHNGDAIDGDHHQSGDVCTTNEVEQADIHIELMNELQKRINWQRGDEMYYTRGTPTHVHEKEDYIAEQMNAELHDLLKMKTNGAMSWFTHHGPAAGKGANEGNSVRNWLKNIHVDALRDEGKAPDIVYTGHVHKPIYSVYSARGRDYQYQNIHGIILPSWQGKTRYAWKVAAMESNMIGGVIHEIKADGVIAAPEFIVMNNG